MAANIEGSKRPLIGQSEIGGEHLLPLARILALAFGVIAGAHALEWILVPTAEAETTGPARDLVAAASFLVLTAISLGGLTLARVRRTDPAILLLIGGPMVVATAATYVAPDAQYGPFIYGISIVLAGLLLGRAAVLRLAGLAALLFLVPATLAEIQEGTHAEDLADEVIDSALPFLAFMLAIALLGSEYSGRLRGALALLMDRTADLEASHQRLSEHARQLEEAREQAERHARETGAAKEEIERKREIGLAVAREIHTMAQELAATSSQQASGTAQQAAAMSEIVATMEELSRSAAQIAGNSSHVSELASSALESAQTGREAVEETIAALDRIRTEVRGVAEKNLALGRRTQETGEIIEVITEIADRTHLLALNAAIESAAAGEYGRRFGVVASQVKELATESKSATSQVRAAVMEIQRAASATVLAAEKAQAEVDSGIRLGRGTGEAIAQMVGNVEQVAVAAKEMLLATQQQESASEQVVSTVREIEQVTRQSAEGSRQTSQAVGKLMAAAERLQ